MLTPLQEIFILLEDEKVVPLYRINRWGKKANGVLAKFKNLSYAEKIKKEDEFYYKITEKGEREFDKILKPLKETGKWDGKWRLVIFDIPEVNRDVRDRLRRALTKMGMGLLQASVWISPNDIKSEIEEIKNRLKLQNKIKFFEVSRTNGIDNTIIQKSWNLPELEDEYKLFNLSAERILKNINKDTNPKYSAKKLIFQYALILKKDPIMPWEFRRKDHYRNKANEIYKQLRTYVV
ncbi:MAG: Repressor in ring oxydation complex/ phenylacetic acid degradation pathway related protein (PaaX) [Berkelbacteria bacterium GW2011_GWB1_38_5]|uniref:Repressor in ring oxydation complex/ phenylacetic acid degradation pathway related protein (PaaX) n=2 Tax=Candidatus Berkelbacteria TaxID=1618330 RepID=A0A0G0LIP3_9BACT|nr:MAG: Repressor in ring oxydation complex/ phenylacetic acid degradation pathway related protein (PaaX) [Berkelbacteria bacterium GW2011_GWB1_38_5]KKQ90937.1 MAG: Repressor in ring oxydation complex/ phenylacetic acid degradation pathway related protein (PaaX) [Berkelbacteria bacterium GW2011_GWA1_39_10]